MADKKLTDLTAITELADGDLFYVGDDPAGTPSSKKITVEDAFASVPATTGVSAKLGAAGPDADHDLELVPKGAGRVKTAGGTGVPASGGGLDIGGTRLTANNSSGVFSFRNSSDDLITPQALAFDAYNSDGSQRLASLRSNTSPFGTLHASGGVVGWTASSTEAVTTVDAAIGRAAANELQFGNATTWGFRTEAVTSGVNYVKAKGSTTTNPAELQAEGSDTNIDLQLTPKGSGEVRFGTHSAIGAETVTGYIEIKDAGGTTRKIGVVS